MYIALLNISRTKMYTNTQQTIKKKNSSYKKALISYLPGGTKIYLYLIAMYANKYIYYNLFLS